MKTECQSGRGAALFARRCTDAFALWLLLGVCWAWMRPEAFTWFKPHITFGLGLIMLGMGLTLKPDDCRGAFSGGRAFFIGVTGQFVIMPLCAWTTAKALHLEPAQAAGLVLVGCCPGGTASNVITFLAGGNVALSVAMTATSTLLAVGLTPWLTAFYAGEFVPVPVGAMLIDMAAVVLLPVAAGVVLNRVLPGPTARLAAFSPLMSVALIVLIVGAIIGDRRESIAAAGVTLPAAVAAFHFSGFALGYAAAKLGRVSVADRRTISIEVGMQNSGLGAKLAAAHFVSEPMAAVPAVISAVVHSLIGSLLAAIWRLRPGSPPRRMG